MSLNFTRVVLANAKSKASVSAVGILRDSGQFVGGRLDGRIFTTL